MKQEPSSQIDMEDSVSQEPNFDDAAELGSVSKIIFIQNLVRPFTLNQLKDLLKQSGKIVEEYFWIDKIKSKCFVMVSFFLYIYFIFILIVVIAL